MNPNTEKKCGRTTIGRRAMPLTNTRRFAAATGRAVAMGVVLIFVGVLAFTTGCRTAPPLPSVNLNEPGWTVRQGQAIWKRGPSQPEIAGEILVATQPNGRAFVQFSKNPFPLVIAQSAANRWQLETPTDGKRYSGHGKPPARLIFLYLARALSGETLGSKWQWIRLESEGWKLTNRANGEWVEAHFMQ